MTLIDSTISAMVLVLVEITDDYDSLVYMCVFRMTQAIHSSILLVGYEFMP